MVLSISLFCKSSRLIPSSGFIDCPGSYRWDGPTVSCQGSRSLRIGICAHIELKRRACWAASQPVALCLQGDKSKGDLYSIPVLPVSTNGLSTLRCRRVRFKCWACALIGAASHRRSYEAWGSLLYISGHSLTSHECIQYLCLDKLLPLLKMQVAIWMSSSTSRAGEYVCVLKNFV